MNQLCADVIAFPESPGPAPERWVLYNVHTRAALGVGPEAFDVLAQPDEAEAAGLAKTYRIWNIWRFSHVDGLLADPSRFVRDATTWGEPKLVDRSSLIKLLREHCLLVESMETYRARFASKRSLLDREHFGNYHQQLGQHLMAFARVDPGKWWVQQKFTPGLKAIRADNLYGAVQDRFLDRWMPKRVRPGQSILDLGCGPGVIARKMARLGAKVLGVDPNPEYMRLASELAEGDCRFEKREVGAKGALDDLPDASFDLVFMSDALLFYFVPYGPEQTADLGVLLADLKRLLKPNGRFVSLEPHPFFYILPWLGAPDRPWTIATEYLHTQWRINPPLETLAKPFLANGFSITGIEELCADPDDPAVDFRARRFAAEYPVWLLLELRKDALLNS